MLRTGCIKCKTYSKKLRNSQKQLRESQKEIINLQTNFKLKEEELMEIKSSKLWKIFTLIKKLILFIFPIGSYQRKILKICLDFLFVIKNIPSIIRARLAIVFEKKIPRNINLLSKKIVYIGHPHHIKTKSTKFLLEYLQSFFDVKIIIDNSWRGDSFPDLSFVDNSYLGVIFFQYIPNNQKILENIKNDNLIFFPMYDAYGEIDYEFWQYYKNLKIINFSKTIHKKIKRWGFDSMYIQYFPESGKFHKGKTNEVFFWQRLSRLNINTIDKLFEKTRVKIHIHKVLDPFQKFTKPTKDQEKKYSITYSKWIKEKKDSDKIIEGKAIYIAPREYEGIGRSFLDAMVMGKAIVAPNNPTMNEYIKHNKTGYLYNLDNPKPIDLSNLDKVQWNAYLYMKRGFKRWEKEKYKIIDFILKK